jgi:hypothetical protein
MRNLAHSFLVGGSQATRLGIAARGLNAAACVGASARGGQLRLLVVSVQRSTSEAAASEAARFPTLGSSYSCGIWRTQPTESMSSPSSIVVRRLVGISAVRLAPQTGIKLRRDPDKPKKPMSPYFRFLAYYRTQHSGLKPTEVAKAAALEWKALADKGHTSNHTRPR